MLFSVMCDTPERVEQSVLSPRHTLLALLPAYAGVRTTCVCFAIVDRLLAYQGYLLHRLAVVLAPALSVCDLPVHLQSYRLHPDRRRTGSQNRGQQVRGRWL